MSSVVILRVRQVMITLALMVTCLENASASPNTLTVQDARPVAKAIQELENRYGWRITYEDPPYIHSSDMPDVTPLVQEGSSAAPGANHLLVPKAGVLSFPLPDTKQDELSTVNSVVKIYNESHSGFVFAVVQGVGMLHVVPRQMTGLSGNLEPVQPVLDTVITIEPKERTAAALIQEICNKISIATNTHVGIGTVPLNMLVQTKTSIGGSGKTARSILEQLIVETGARLSLSWRLLYYPRAYALNISWVMPGMKQ